MFTSRTMHVPPSRASTSHSKARPSPPSTPSNTTRRGGSQAATRPGTCISGPGPNDTTAAPPSRSSTVWGTYHDEIPGPVAMARHTSSGVPGTSTSASSVRRSSSMGRALPVVGDAAMARSDPSGPPRGRQRLRDDLAVEPPGEQLGIVEAPAAGPPRWRDPHGTGRGRRLQPRAVADHHRELARFAFRLCGDRTQAEDIVAEAYARVWPNWRRGRVTTLLPYLMRTVANLAFAGHRRRRLERRTGGRVEDGSRTG